MNKVKNLDKANKYIKEVESTFEKPRNIDKDTKLKVGVDLGTSNIVLTVLDENNNLVTKQGKTYQDITKENENYNKKIDENNK